MPVPQLVDFAAAHHEGRHAEPAAYLLNVQAGGGEQFGVLRVHVELLKAQTHFQHHDAAVSLTFLTCCRMSSRSSGLSTEAPVVTRLLDHAACERRALALSAAMAPPSTFAPMMGETPIGHPA